MPTRLGRPVIWLPVACGLAALYLPTLWELATGIWQTEEHAHGPIVLAVVLWLIWRTAPSLQSPGSVKPSLLGTPLLVLGLFFFVAGRSQGILVLEVASLPLVLSATVLLLHGREAIARLGFPLFYMIFLVPIPGIVVDAMTGYLKSLVSAAAEMILYHAGYPVAREGVILQVGQYQLLVADACSGLNSIISLSALGILFMYLIGRTSWLHNLIMLGAIVPIAFVANVIRVIVLILITHYFGDAAGQGFLHGAAGIVLLVAALLFLFALDSTLAASFRLGRRLRNA